MSVIVYSKHEILSMLAACWAHGSIGSLDGIRKIAQYAEVGNSIMAANCEAYNNTYDDEAEPEKVSPAEVKDALVRKTVYTVTEGVRTLQGIRYNIVANNGHDAATEDVIDGLLGLYQDYVRLLHLRLGGDR